MNEFTIKEFNDLVENGTQNFENEVKLILHKNDPLIFDKIKFEDSSFFLDPLLFDKITTKDQNINLLVLGRLKDFEKFKNIVITTNKDGVFFLPYIGYFRTNLPSSRIDLNYNNGFELFSDNKKISYLFNEIEYFDETIELLNFPLLEIEKYFYDFNGDLVDVEIIDISEKQKKNLVSALNIIKSVNYEWYLIMKSVTKKLMIFNDQQIKRNSFTSIFIHGFSLFNAFQENYNEVFFIEDISHQCGHTIFNAFLNSKIDLFLLNESTIIKSNNPNSEGRSLVVVLHALYTYFAILENFEKCISNNIFEGDKEHELNGRLVFTIYKFYSDYNLLINPDSTSKYLNEKGVTIIQFFKLKFDLICSIHRERLEHLDVTNQPYNFSYEIFKTTNSIDLVDKL